MKTKRLNKRQVDVEGLARLLEMGPDDLRRILGIRLDLNEVQTFAQGQEFYDTHPGQAERLKVLELLLSKAVSGEDFRCVLKVIPKTARSLLKKARAKYSLRVRKELLAGALGDWDLSKLAVDPHLEMSVRQMIARKLSWRAKEDKSKAMSAIIASDIAYWLGRVETGSSEEKVLTKRLRRLVTREVKSLFTLEAIWNAIENRRYDHGVYTSTFLELAFSHLERLYRQRIRSVFPVEEARKLWDDLSGRASGNDQWFSIRVKLLRLVAERMDKLTAARLKINIGPNELARLYHLLPPDSKRCQEVLIRLAHHFPKAK